MKKIIFFILLVVLCAGIGLMIPIIMGNSVEGVGLSEDILKQNFEKELQQLLLSTNEIQQVDRGVDTNETTTDVVDSEALSTNSNDTDEIESKVVETEDGSTTELDIQTDEVSIQIENNLVSDELDFFETGSIPAGEDKSKIKPIVGNKWVDQKITENIDEISEADLSVGLALYSLLDTNYLFGLAEGGLTPEEKKEMQTYLSESLSPAQVSAVMTLYSKYVHLLN